MYIHYAQPKIAQKMPTVAYADGKSNLKQQIIHSHFHFHQCHD